MKKAIVFILTVLLTSSVFANPKTEVKNLLKQHNKAMQEHNIEKVKTFYSDDYISSDGFDISDMEDMLKKTYSSYKDIKYKTKITNLTVNDNWALVQMTDKSKAKVYPNNDKKYKDKAGCLDGKSVYNVYLTKDKNEWKIVYDEILAEETSLRYGIAKKIDMELNTPVFIKNGGDYDLSLKMKKPDNVIALGSISREEITYPVKDYTEKFRKIPESGDLERMVKANDKNLGEYAIASVGFSTVSVNQEATKARIQIVGMAYLMKRINMEKIPPKHIKKEALVENKK